MKLLHCLHEGQETYVEYYIEVESNEFIHTKEQIQAEGWNLLEEHTIASNTFATFSKGEDAIFVSFYPELKEMQKITEPKSTYLNYKDEAKEQTFPVLLRQIDLSDFGLSYVIRISDGRLIVFDGGFPYEEDVDKLMSTMCEFSEGEKPQIAAWIMSHPHIDHYQSYLVFHEKYKDEVTIEKFIYNFPGTSEEDCEAYPAIAKEKEYIRIDEFNQKVEEIGCPVYRAHTGQIYQLGDVRLEILSSPDHTLMQGLNELNSISLMMKMEIAGQTIFWGMDGQFKKSKLVERYGSYLKSDILQIPHHSFSGGTKEGYALIDPTVCLLPGFEQVSYGWHSIRREENHYLISELHVQDYLAGGRGDITIELPYTPRENGKALLFHRVQEEQKRMGSKSWIFMDLSKEETEFSILNMSVKDVEVNIELFFEEANMLIRFLKVKAGKRCVTRMNLAELAEIQESGFTAYFFSDWPVVIKGAKAADYIG